MRVSDYVRLLSDHGFQVSPSRWAMMALISGFTINNSVLARLQHAIYGHKIQAQQIDPPPLFLVGHWRSGTTLLHELLSLDTSLAYPSTVECFLPHHFLLSEPYLKPLLALVLPAKRPMDNMTTGTELPQEDEFALIGLGAPTPYLRMAFPNDVRPYDNLLDMEDLPEAVQERFEKHLRMFFQSLMVKKQRRLLLKSPTHTGRMGWLAEKFPGSRFIHIARNPVEVFLSTKRLWRSLDEVQGLQVPRYSDAELEAMVFQMQTRMYHGYMKARKSLPANQLVEIQFEQLLQDPIGTIQSAFDQLELELDKEARRSIQRNMEKRRSHKTADYQTDHELVQRVMQHWSQYADVFGYDADSGQSNLLTTT